MHIKELYKTIMLDKTLLRHFVDITMIDHRRLEGILYGFDENSGDVLLLDATEWRQCFNADNNIEWMSRGLGFVVLRGNMIQAVADVAPPTAGMLAPTYDLEGAIKR